MHYLLFLDETGDFSDPGAPTLLGGPLVNARNTRQLREDLQRQLQACFPGLPWPLHAAELTAPLAPVGWRLRGHAWRDPALDDTLLAHPLLERLPSWPAAARAWQEGHGRAEAELLSLSLRAGRELAARSGGLYGVFHAAATRRRALLAAAVRETLPILPLPGGRGAACGAASPAGDLAASPSERWLRAYTAAVERALALLEDDDTLD